MHLPTKLLESLHGIEGFDKEAFEKVHSNGGQVTSIRLNPSKFSEPLVTLSFGNNLAEAVPWSGFGYYLKERPSFTFDPLFHAGCYYVQESSSMFLEQALKQVVDLSQPLKILDLAAAPGGKSTHIQSLISRESLLVSNEVIKSRSNILKDNIIKWGGDNVVITNNDPKAFARLENYFDVIVVDAPCSGSGLFRRDEEALGEWSLSNVHLCSQRQQRILSDVWPALKKNGVLIYATCSYSKEEDETILDWMQSTLAIENCPLSIDPAWGITKISTGGGIDGYRFWPDKVKGEGFFLSCVRKTDAGPEKAPGTKGKMEMLDRKGGEIINKWLNGKDHVFAKIQNKIYAFPEKLKHEINVIINNLHVIYAGVIAGELIREKLIPSHELAMSPLIGPEIENVALNYEEAITYLKKKDLAEVNTGKGWKLVTYKNHPLGWINVLQNRINNYYPKELRILKDI